MRIVQHVEDPSACKHKHKAMVRQKATTTTVAAHSRLTLYEQTHLGIIQTSLSRQAGTNHNSGTNKQSGLYMIQSLELCFSRHRDCAVKCCTINKNSAWCNGLAAGLRIKRRGVKWTHAPSDTKAKLGKVRWWREQQKDFCGSAKKSKKVHESVPVTSPLEAAVRLQMPTR
jgi:hypothetical protein